jgi:hypothetical protein
MLPLIDTCGNCGTELRGKSVLYDERTEQHFCDSQCFREWADDKGAEEVLAFYQTMNVEEAEV